MYDYSKSFYEDADRTWHRVAWLRLVSCSQQLLHWIRESALPPASVVAALQAAQIDPALDLFYPELNRKITAVLQVIFIRSQFMLWTIQRLLSNK